MLQADVRFPAQKPPGVADARSAVLDVLIAAAVISSALHFLEAGEGRKPRTQGMLFKARDEHLSKLADAGFIVRVADVDDFPVANAIGVFDNAVETLDALTDVGEAAFLTATVDQLDGRSFHQVENELRDGARAADAGRVEGVEFRADPIER